MINSRQTSLFIALSALCLLSVTSLVGCGELGPFGLQLTNEGTAEVDRVVESGPIAPKPTELEDGNGGQGGGVKPGPIVPKPTKPEDGNGGVKPGTGDGEAKPGTGDGETKPGTTKPKPTEPENGDGGQGSENSRAIMLMLCFVPGDTRDAVVSGDRKFPFSYRSTSGEDVTTAEVPYGALVPGRPPSLLINGSAVDMPKGTVCGLLDMAYILTSTNASFRPDSVSDSSVVGGSDAFVFDVMKQGGKQGVFNVFYSDDCNKYTHDGRNYSKVPPKVKCGYWSRLNYQEAVLIEPSRKLEKVDKVYYTNFLNPENKVIGIRIYAPPNFQMQVEGP